jgi:hypothetical protein
LSYRCRRRTLSRAVAVVAEDGDDLVFEVALDDDVVVLDGASYAALFLEEARKFLESGGRAGKAADKRDRFAVAVAGVGEDAQLAGGRMRGGERGVGGDAEVGIGGVDEAARGVVFLLAAGHGW